MTLEWKGDAVAKAIKIATAIGSYVTAEQILTEAGNNVPRDTGTLARSGTISIDEDISAIEGYSQALAGAIKTAKKADAKENTKKVYISYNTPYAHRQHEDLQFKHTFGGAKYLEKGWNAKINNITKNIKAEVKKQGIE